MEERQFSLIGGPLHRLGERFGLVRGTSSLRLGIALATCAWAVEVALAWAEGHAAQLFSIGSLGGHVRLLIVVPLFFLCESIVGPRAVELVSTLTRSSIVKESGLPSLRWTIDHVMRWQDAWVPEALCAIGALALSLAAPWLDFGGTSSGHDATLTGVAASAAHGWYLLVCLPVFRFLLLRWVFRLGLWGYFLWRIARLDLQLVPTHPDGTAGLGMLEEVQLRFAPLVIAVSAVQAAAFAEDFAAGRRGLDALYPIVALVLVLDMAVFLAPLLVFTPKLWTSRVSGVARYTELGARYVEGFEARWLDPRHLPAEPLLGTPDLQSLADLANSVTIVREMRAIPMSRRLLRAFALAAALPFLPLLTLRYPVVEIARRIIGTMTGL